MDKASSYSASGLTNKTGVFVAGSATGPETIDDSIAQGKAAAMAALEQRQLAARLVGLREHRLGVFIPTTAAQQPDELERPHLDLSGPILTRAFETLVQGSEEQGGIEYWTDALKLKSQMFQQALGQGHPGDLPLDTFKGLCAFHGQCAPADWSATWNSRPTMKWWMRSSSCWTARKTRPTRMPGWQRSVRAFPG